MRSGSTQIGVRRFPAWLRKRVPSSEQMKQVKEVLAGLRLTTVCQEARCPNLGECFAAGTATFMILGDICCRGCTFCAVKKGKPLPPDPDEPRRVAEAAARMGLRHVVVTSVTRDDLPDGGSGHFALTVRAIHERCRAAVEVLTPDFQGRNEDIDRVLAAGPEVFNHNVETVPRLYPEVRPQADYERSLRVLKRARHGGKRLLIKSGIMVGLGEREDELVAVFGDLAEAGCQMLTIGQYLPPSPAHHRVVEFVEPERFRLLKEHALRMGFKAVASGPFVRSSYKAEEMAAVGG